MATELIAELRDLCIAFRRDGRELPVVRGVSLAIPAGDRIALVGESGCGKTVTCLSFARLPPLDRAQLGGQVRVAGRDVLHDARALSQARGRQVAYVFQDPSGSLNPVMRVGEQIRECLPPAPVRAQAEAVRSLLHRVRLPDPATCARAYPCELSGGMQQRVMLAIALAARPRLLVADEPTTALDVTTQAHVLDLVDEIAAADGMAVLLVTHNLGLVAGRSRTMHVMYAGQIVESGPAPEVLTAPAHPYTRGLLDAVPSLDAPMNGRLPDIPGMVPAPDALPVGCAFAPRCPRRSGHCDVDPGLTPDLLGRAGRHVRCWHPHLPADATFGALP